VDEMGMNILYALLYLFLAPVGGGLLAGLDRKLTARMQRRVGPPVVQPFYDVLKLFEKERIAVNEAQGFYLAGFLFFMILSGIFFFAQGDILLVIFTLTMAGICLVVASFSSSSPCSQMGAERELLQIMAYEPMLLFVAIAFYLKCNTFDLSKIMASLESNFLYMPGIFIGFLFILQIKFRKSPFDLSMSHEIHQELVQGIKTEFSGGMLALFEIAEWYEKIFLLGFVYLFFKWRDPWSGVTGILVCAAVLFFPQGFFLSVFGRLTHKNIITGGNRDAADKRCEHRGTAARDLCKGWQDRCRRAGSFRPCRRERDGGGCRWADGAARICGSALPLAHPGL